MSPRILLVDDNHDFREALVELLELAGFDAVVSFDNAMDGLNYLHDNRVDIVLSDLLMPNMNGRQFFDKVQELQLPPCFILITGSDLSDVDVDPRSKIPLLHKPFSLTQLMNFMQFTLEERAESFYPNKNTNFAEAALA